LDDRIEPGQRWDRAIAEQLAACDRLIVLLSPEAVESEIVLDELTYALEHKKDVVPVLLRDCELPLRLRRFQYIDSRNDTRAEMITGQLRYRRHTLPTTTLTGAAITVGWALFCVISAGVYFNLVGMPLDPPAYLFLAIISLGFAVIARTLWRRRRRWA
jgi:hypothetical protein